MCHRYLIGIECRLTLETFEIHNAIEANRAADAELCISIGCPDQKSSIDRGVLRVGFLRTNRIGFIQRASLRSGLMKVCRLERHETIRKVARRHLDHKWRRTLPNSAAKEESSRRAFTSIMPQRCMDCRLDIGRCLSLHERHGRRKNRKEYSRQSCSTHAQPPIVCEKLNFALNWIR